MSPAERHPDWWFDDGNLVLQADKTLFNVHRSYICRRSAFFRDMFLLDQPKDCQDGTQERPLLVPEVSSVGLAGILAMLYNTWGAADIGLDVPGFAEILRAAHRLQFEDVVHAVVHHLQSQYLPPELRLFLGLQCCGVDDWAYPAFLQVVYRDVGLLKGSGLDTATKAKVLLGRAKVTAMRLAAAENNKTRLRERQPPFLCSEHIIGVWAEIACHRAPSDSVDALTELNGLLSQCRACRRWGSRESDVFSLVFSKDAEVQALKDVWDGDIV